MRMKHMNPHDLVNNPSNPRSITGAKFRELVRSLKEFPEMLEARPIVVNKDMVVLGGNMRLRAAIKAGLSQVPVHVASWDAAKDEQFVIRDNVSHGQWDWDLLANDWDAGDVTEWGLDVWDPDPDPKEETPKCEHCGK